MSYWNTMAVPRYGLATAHQCERHLPSRCGRCVAAQKPRRWYTNELIQHRDLNGMFNYTASWERIRERSGFACRWDSEYRRVNGRCIETGLVIVMPNRMTNACWVDLPMTLLCSLSQRHANPLRSRVLSHEACGRCLSRCRSPCGRPR